MALRACAWRRGSRPRQRPLLNATSYEATMQRTQLLRIERRASASERVHTGFEEPHRKEVGEALRIRCHARQAIHLHLVCAQRGVKALRPPQAALARPPAASLARAACGALRKKQISKSVQFIERQRRHVEISGLEPKHTATARVHATSKEPVDHDEHCDDLSSRT